MTAVIRTWFLFCPRDHDRKQASPQQRRLPESSLSTAHCFSLRRASFQFLATHEAVLFYLFFFSLLRSHPRGGKRRNGKGHPLRESLWDFKVNAIPAELLQRGAPRSKAETRLSNVERYRNQTTGTFEENANYAWIFKQRGKKDILFFIVTKQSIKIREITNWKYFLRCVFLTLYS